MGNAGYAVKFDSCPTCEGEKTAQRFQEEHIEIDGEYYELVTEAKLESMYSDYEITEKHELVRKSEDVRERSDNQ